MGLGQDVSLTLSGTANTMLLDPTLNVLEKDQLLSALNSAGQV